MRQFYTSVLERRKEFTNVIDTPPFEGGWASEAIFFVRVESLGEGVNIDLRVQLSADGMHWVDEGATLGPLNSPGDHLVRVSHFGNWLKLSGTVIAGETEQGASATLTIHLALKE